MLEDDHPDTHMHGFQERIFFMNLKHLPIFVPSIQQPHVEVNLSLAALFGVIVAAVISEHTFPIA
jgi:hypothetical protein